MTGYLARLAGRAAEPGAPGPPLVRPRVPSRFEVLRNSHDTEDQDQLSSPPAAPAGHTAAPHWTSGRVAERSPRIAAEQRGTDSSAPASLTPAAPVDRRPRDDEPDPRRTRIDGADPAPTWIAEHDRSPSAPDERVEQATLSSSHPESRGPGTPAPPPQPASADEDDGRRPSTVGGDGSEPVAAAVARARPTPGPVDDLDIVGHSSRRAGTTPQDREPAETVVSIHIGRVDVRTPSPAASRTTATHRARPASEPGRLTLSEFLRGEREPR